MKDQSYQDNQLRIVNRWCGCFCRYCRSAPATSTPLFFTWGSIPATPTPRNITSESQLSHSKDRGVNSWMQGLSRCDAIRKRIIPMDAHLQSNRSSQNLHCRFRPIREPRGKQRTLAIIRHDGAELSFTLLCSTSLPSPPTIKHASTANTCGCATWRRGYS
jgi:hypothetical protein